MGRCKLNVLPKLGLFSIIVLSMTYSNDSQSSYDKLRFNGFEKQKYDNTCGVASLSDIFKNHFSIEKNELELLKYFHLKPEYSFADLSLVADKFHIKTAGVKITPSQIKEIHSPAILYLKRFGKGHFVILKGVDEFWVQIQDPAWGILNYTHKQFNQYWLQSDGLGRALIFIKQSNLKINRDKVYQKIIPTY